MHVFRMLVTVVGVLMSLGYYPQAGKIWRSRHADGVSRLGMMIFAVGSTIWFIYGVFLNDLVIMLSFVFGMVGAWLVFILTFLYE